MKVWPQVNDRGQKGWAARVDRVIMWGPTRAQAIAKAQRVAGQISRSSRKGYPYALTAAAVGAVLLWSTTKA